ncbi:MAG: hypothetical protein OQK29_11145, partial [Ignavibacteriaceae bacterium]|nr:hypothetical protein [Ignavibacteriaceae bacterium]
FKGCSHLRGHASRASQNENIALKMSRESMISLSFFLKREMPLRLNRKKNCNYSAVYEKELGILEIGAKKNGHRDLRDHRE